MAISAFILTKIISCDRKEASLKYRIIQRRLQSFEWNSAVFLLYQAFKIIFFRTGDMLAECLNGLINITVN